MLPGVARRVHGVDKTLPLRQNIFWVPGAAPKEVRSFCVGSTSRSHRSPTARLLRTMHKVMGLSSSSRAAIKAAQEARLAPRTPSPDKLHREVFPSEHRLHTISNLDPLDPPPLEKTQEDMDIDAEVAELLSKRYTGRRPSSPEEILRRVGEDA